MYSWEIDKILNENNFAINAETYIQIISTSPQINHIKYQAFGDYFEIWTDDRYEWKFKVIMQKTNKGEKGNEN